MNAIKSWKAWASVGLVLAAAGVAFLLADGARAEPKDWPALTMTYDLTTSVNGVDVRQTRELVYTSRDAWVETVISADSYTISQGTFSDVGSYQKVGAGQYNYYDATTGDTRTEAIAAGSVHIPRGGLLPMPLEDIEAHTGKQLTSTTTATRVCFDDDCIDAAAGWEWAEASIVFAADARGIPVKIGDFVVTEVRVQGGKETLR